MQVDDAVLAEIEKLAELAPLHNPAAVQAIRETQQTYPGIPVVAVFDDVSAEWTLVKFKPA